MTQEARIPPGPADLERPPDPEWRQHALFLDFDGTLAPIVDRPENVSLARPTLRLLERLIAATDGAVAILSGRGLDDLECHLHGLPLALSGSHGLEFHRPCGPPYESDDMSPAALDNVLARLEAFADAHGLRLERKPGAVALHFRNQPSLSEACREAVAGAAAAEDLRVLHGNMVSEAALPGIDKGTGLRRFLSEPPFSGRIPIMLGDDTTDEDGFRAAQEQGGFGVRIGKAETTARFRVPSMEDGLAWLESSLGSGTKAPSAG